MAGVPLSWHWRWRALFVAYRQKAKSGARVQLLK
jgi:hypothetical protein